VPVWRVVLWTLLGLLTAAAAAGIALGVANQPGQTPAQWVDSVYAATARAGTARFTSLQISSSSNPDLRNSVSSSGLIDFTRGALQMKMVDRFVDQSRPQPLLALSPPTVSVESIALGESLYTGVHLDGTEHWLETISPRDSRSRLYPEGIHNTEIPAGFGELSAAVAVRDLGKSMIGGATTTKFAVSVGPALLCPGTSALASTDIDEYPRTVWIDSVGRIVQERSVVHVIFGAPPAWRRHSLPGATTTTTTTQHGQRPVAIVGLSTPSGKSTMVTTIRLTDFGAPDSIKPPHVARSNIDHISASTGQAESTECPNSYVLKVGSLPAKGLKIQAARRPPR
jgi:hypothetical protein